MNHDLEILHQERVNFQNKYHPNIQRAQNKEKAKIKEGTE